MAEPVPPSMANEKATNVFGTPITDETLAIGGADMRSPPANHNATPVERARAALNAINSGGKRDIALSHVHKLEKRYDDGISTLCIVYNATGNYVTLDSSHTWYGYLYKDPYPTILGNGQWGAFMHVKPDWPNITLDGSSAGVIYKGQNAEGREHDYLISWSNPYNRSYGNKAYTEILTPGAEPGWEELKNRTTSSDLNKRDEHHGCVSMVSIGEDTTSVFEAVLTLEGAEK